MVRYKVEWSHLVEDPNGDWVKFEEVEQAIKEAVDDEIFSRELFESYS